MESLDRYLNFIRFLLPRGKQEDIIAELSEDLHAQVADREAELGRPINEAELEALLKRCGHPLMVAARYQAQQQLIGQPFYPLYLLALKMVQWVLLPLLLVIGLMLSVFRPHMVDAMMQAVGNAIGSAIFTVGLLTVAFAVLERLQVKLHFLDNWRLSDLPKVPVIQDPSQITRSASFGGFAGLLFFIVWWVGLIRLPQLPHVHFLQALPEGFFWPVLLVAGAEMLLHLVNLFLPWWTRRRAAFRLVLDVCSLVLLAAIATAWPWFAIHMDAGMTADIGPSIRDVAKLEQVVNLSLLVSLGVMALSYVARLVQDLRRARGLPAYWNWLMAMFAN
ncbi:MAG TPA: hypothetical protein VHP13_01625 [Gammaproteobacteria bacterium]|jgi:hypothetical protein|nr:hypothetical protein [Gammaproteobacteria bacterium]